MSMPQRLKPIERQRLGAMDNIDRMTFSDMDFKAGAQEMLQQARQLKQEIEELSSEVAAVRRDVEDNGDRLTGVEAVVDEGSITMVKKVINAKSCAERAAIVSISASPRTWKTKCGWQFANKAYAKTFNEHANLTHTYKTCPTCIAPNLDEDDSTSSSDSDD